MRDAKGLKGANDADLLLGNKGPEDMSNTPAIPAANWVSEPAQLRN